MNTATTVTWFELQWVVGAVVEAVHDGVRVGVEQRWLFRNRHNYSVAESNRFKWFPALRRGDWARAADAPRRHAALPDERYSLPVCSAPGLKVLAARDIRMGEVVFSDAGILRRWPDQHTIQIGKQSKVEVGLK